MAPRTMPPNHYQREQLIDGVGFVLPPRRAAKPVAIILFVVGLVFTGIGMRLSIRLIESLDTADLFDIVFGILGVIPLLGGLAPIMAALVLLAGRNTVQVRRGQVNAIDQLGPLRWTRSRPAQRIAQLEVNTGTVSTNRGPAKPMENFASLFGLPPETEAHAPGKARYKGTFILAWGYPRKLLTDLAGELARELDPDGQRLVGDHATAIPVIQRFGSMGELRDGRWKDTPVDRPPNAISVLEPSTEGLTLRVPPVGFRKGSKGLGCFGIVWTAFVACFTAVMIYSIISGNSGDLDSPLKILGAFAFISVFWAVGLGMILAAINAGRRKAIIDVIGQPPNATLLISQQSIFKTKQHEWQAADISHICLGPSGVEVNNRPVMELQIHPIQGKKTGLLSQLDDQEIRWIAYELRQALGIPGMHIEQGETK